MHHPHLVLAPIVIGIINNHKFERLPMPVMVEAEVVGRGSHHAKTTMAAVVIPQDCWCCRTVSFRLSRCKVRPFSDALTKQSYQVLGVVMKLRNLLAPKHGA